MVFLQCLAIAFSLYGWGAILAKGMQRAFHPAILPAIGLSVVVVVGGVLNALSLVGSGSILLVLGIGLGFAIWDLVGRSAANRSNGKPLFPAKTETLLPYLLVLGGFLVWGILFASPTAFNVHDDLEKYFKYPVRMLATGTLSTGFFDAVGTETLGGMSFLHAIMLSAGSLNTMAAFDLVIAPFVMLLLVVGVLSEMKAPLALRLTVPLLLLFIDPQSVNISANYTGACLLALLLAYPVITKSADEFPDSRDCLVYGFIFSALTVLKTSFVFLMIPYFLTFCLLLFIRRRKGGLKTVLLVPFIALGLALPWFLVHADKWTGLLRAVGSDSSAANPSSLRSLNEWNPFSLSELFYGFGVSNLHYTLIVAFVLIAAVVSFLRERRLDRVRVAALAGALSLVFIYTFWMWYVAPRTLDLNAGLRYLIPLLVAGVVLLPIALLSDSEGDDRRRARSGFIATLPVLILLLAFAPAAYARLAQAASAGNALPFEAAKKEGYQNIVETALSPNFRQYVRGIQALIPERRRILVWSTFSHHLDYRRNEIADTDPAGLASPWLAFPFDGGSQEKLAYLRERGIEYLVYQHGGFGFRSEENIRRMTQSAPRRRLIAERISAFQSFVDGLMERSDEVEVLYKDQILFVIRLSSGP